MKFVGILELALLPFISALLRDRFYDDNNLTVEVSEYTKGVASRPIESNPVYLDASKHGLYPTKVLTIIASPKFKGNPPPGITAFMTSQVLLSGEKKNGFVYPLFVSEAIKHFNGKTNTLKFANNCTVDANGKEECKPGYSKVIVNRNNINPNNKLGSEKNTKESSKPTNDQGNSQSSGSQAPSESAPTESAPTESAPSEQGTVETPV